MLFNPSRREARQFFYDSWRKYEAHEPITPLEQIAVALIGAHPEYHALLRDRERWLEHDWRPEHGETNPFLHLSLHLAIEEQLSIDQPPVFAPALREHKNNWVKTMPRNTLYLKRSEK